MRTKIAILLGLTTLAGACWAGDNGIHVNEWKLFDERSLIAKFNRLRASVDANSIFIGGDTLKNSINKVQASSVALSQLGVSLKAQFPTRSYTNTSGQTVKVRVDEKGIPVLDSNGNLIIDSTSSDNNQTSHTLEQVKIPEAAGTSFDSGVVKKDIDGIGYLDTLQEQTQLTYEMFNISMLLERSITDRIVNLQPTDEDSLSFAPRQTIVLEFPITIDRPKPNCVAEVSITMKNAADRGITSDGPRVVAMMPKARTYNTATMTSSVKGFSFGTVFDVVGLNIGSQNANAKSYIARDVDTVAFSNTERTKDSVTFKWQFRPTLNRKLIEPGTREVFVVLSIPQDQTGIGKILESSTSVDPGQDKKNIFYKGCFKVNTCWRPYCLTNGEVGEKKYELDPPLESIVVRSAPVRDDSLKPFVTDVDVADAGDGNLVATVRGANFFDGTVTSFGGNITSDTDSNRYSENGLRFIFPAEKLFGADPQLIGPYGVSNKVQEPGLSQNLGYKIVPKKSGVTALSATMARVKLYLKFNTIKTRDIELGKGRLAVRSKNSSQTFKSTIFLVKAGPSVYGLNSSPLIVLPDDHNIHGATIEFNVPADILRQNPRVTVLPAIFDRSLARTYEAKIPQDFTVSGVSILGKKNIKGSDGKDKEALVLGIAGTGFYLNGVNKLELSMNDNPINDYKALSDTLVTAVVAKDDFDNSDILIVNRKDSFPVMVSIKDLKKKETPAAGGEGEDAPVKPSVKPKSLAMAPIHLHANVDVDVLGVGLDSIASATCDSVDVGWKLTEEKGTKGKITMTLALTKVPGTRQIVFKMKDGKTFAANLQVLETP